MWLFYVLLFYLVALTIVFSTGEDYKFKRIVFFVLTAGVMVFLSAFRGINVGNDTNEYLSIFKDITNTTIAEYSGNVRFEIGYVGLNKLLSLLSENPQIVIIFTSLFFYFSVFSFISKHSKNVYVSTLLFFVLGYFSMSTNTIRHNTALAILLFGYSFLKDGKNVKFFLMCILAALFHTTALVFVLCFFFKKVKINKSIFAVIMGSVLVVAVLLPIMAGFVANMLPEYAYYFYSEYFNDGFKIASLANVGMSLLFFILGRFSKYEEDKDVFLMTNINFVGLIFMILSMSFTLLSRVGGFFTIFALVLIPNSIQMKVNNPFKRKCYYGSITIAFTAYLILSQVIRPEWNEVFPYDFFWNNASAIINCYWIR